MMTSLKSLSQKNNHKKASVNIFLGKKEWKEFVVRKSILKRQFKSVLYE